MVELFCGLFQILDNGGKARTRERAFCTWSVVGSPTPLTFKGMEPVILMFRKVNVSVPCNL